MADSDEEVLEGARAQLQDALDRFSRNLDAGKSFDESLGAVPMPSTLVTVTAGEIREVGSFRLVLPEGRKDIPPQHWVYRRKDGPEVYVLHLPNRTLLRQRGYVQIKAFVWMRGS